MIRMRRIKKKELEKSGNIYCSFCRPKRINALYRLAVTGSEFSCELHKFRLKGSDTDEHLTDADYQTWMRV